MRPSPTHVTLAVDPAGARGRAAGAALGAREGARTSAPGPSRAATSSPARRSSSRSAGTSPRRSTCARSPTSSSSRRSATPTATRASGSSRRRYLGLVPRGVDPELPEDTRWHPSTSCPRMAFDHGDITLAGRERLRGEALVHERRLRARAAEFTLSELREIYVAALGHAGLGDEPQAGAAAARRARADRRAARARAGPAAGRRRFSASARASSRSRTVRGAAAAPLTGCVAFGMRRRECWRFCSSVIRPTRCAAFLGADFKLTGSS